MTHTLSLLYLIHTKILYFPTSLSHSTTKVYVYECSETKNFSNSFALSNVYTSLPAESYKTISKSQLTISDLNENFILSPVSPENEMSELVVICSE